MAKLRADYAGGCTDENVRPTINIMSLIASGPGKVVGIATGYGLDGPGIKSRCG